MIQSPSLGSGEGGGKGKNVGVEIARITETARQDLKFLVLHQSAGSGEHDHESRVNIQQRTEAEETTP